MMKPSYLLEQSIHEYLERLDKNAPDYVFLREVYPVFMRTLNEHGKSPTCLEEVPELIGPQVSLCVAILATILGSVLARVLDEETQAMIYNGAMIALQVQLQDNLVNGIKIKVGEKKTGTA